MDGIETIARCSPQPGNIGTSHYGILGPTFDQNLPSSRSLISVAITARRVAQSGSAGGSIGNDEKSLSGSRQAPRAVEPSKPARRAKPEAEEPRRASRRSGGGGGGGGGNFDGAWVAVAVGTPCGSSTERFVISGGRISGEWSSGQVSPNGSTTGHGSVSGVELDQFRPLLGPQRLRFIRAIRRLYRTLDRLQTVGKTRGFPQA